MFINQEQRRHYQQYSLDQELRSQVDLMASNSSTLLNHSQTSPFIKVKRSTATGGASATAAPNPVHCVDGRAGLVRRLAEADVSYCPESSSSLVDDDENLLIADRTHFRPIKTTYADGHMFNISASPDLVDYVRTDSGSMFLGSDQYMDYHGADGDAVDPGRTNVSISYQGANVTETAIVDQDNGLDVVDGIVGGNGNCSDGNTTSVGSTKKLRFQVRQNDVPCQTDDLDETSNGSAASSFDIVTSDFEATPFNRIWGLDMHALKDEYYNNKRVEAETVEYGVYKYWDSTSSNHNNNNINNHNIRNHQMRVELSADANELFSSIDHVYNNVTQEQSNGGSASSQEPYMYRPDPTRAFALNGRGEREGEGGEGSGHVEKDCGMQQWCNSLAGHAHQASFWEEKPSMQLHNDVAADNRLNWTFTNLRDIWDETDRAATTITTTTTTTTATMTTSTTSKRNDNIDSESSSIGAALVNGESSDIGEDSSSNNNNNSSVLKLCEQEPQPDNGLRYLMQLSYPISADARRRPHNARKRRHSDEVEFFAGRKATVLEERKNGGGKRVVVETGEKNFGVGCGLDPYHLKQIRMADCRKWVEKSMKERYRNDDSNNIDTDNKNNNEDFSEIDPPKPNVEGHAPPLVSAINEQELQTAVRVMTDSWTARFRYLFRHRMNQNDNVNGNAGTEDPYYDSMFFGSRPLTR